MRQNYYTNSYLVIVSECLRMPIIKNGVMLSVLYGLLTQEILAGTQVPQFKTRLGVTWSLKCN